MSSCSRLPAGPKVWVRWRRIAFLTSSGASLSTTQYDHISVLSGPLGCHTRIMCRVKFGDTLGNTVVTRPGRSASSGPMRSTSSSKCLMWESRITPSAIIPNPLFFSWRPIIVRAVIVAFIERNAPHRHMSNRVVAVIPKKVVGSVFPVGVHPPFMPSAYTLGSAGPPVEHNAKLAVLAIEIFQQRRGFLIKGGEDKSLENVQLGYRD